MDRTGHTERASKLVRKRRDQGGDHDGNRISADLSEPQPTREPTRDRSVDRADRDRSDAG